MFGKWHGGVLRQRLWELRLSRITNCFSRAARQAFTSQSNRNRERKFLSQSGRLNLPMRNGLMCMRAFRLSTTRPKSNCLLDTSQARPYSERLSCTSCTKNVRRDYQAVLMFGLALRAIAISALTRVYFSQR